MGLIILTLLLTTESAAGAELEAEVQRIVDEERTRSEAPAMSMVVVGDGQVLAEYTSGLADVETGRKATMNTLYPAASVSKVLTAALVMRQVEAGRLNLDEPVNTYLEPDFKVRDSSGDPVDTSLRQLLSHYSGLPVSWNGIRDVGDPVPTMAEYLSNGLRLAYPPRQQVIYSNDGFALAGYLAARAAGQTFSEYARDALFEPLGMRNSTFDSPWPLSDAMAAAYGHWFKGGSDRAQHADTTATAPAGALITTAPDLARFALMILGNGELDGARVLRPESIAEMLRMQARVHPKSDQGFGLGFAVREQRGRRMVWWDGSLTGSAARLALLPDAGVGVVVLSNLANNEPTAVAAQRILDVVEPPPSRAVSQPSTGQLDQLAGLYRLRDFVDPKYGILGYLLTFDVERRGNSLFLDSMMTGERSLSPDSFGRYRVSGSLFDNAMVLFDGDDVYVGHLKATRIAVWQSPTALAAYATVLLSTIVSALIWGAVRAIRRTSTTAVGRLRRRVL